MISTVQCEESSKTKRTSGTDDYISPQSFKSGIFTTSSDVFALGQVLKDYFFLSLCFPMCIDDLESKTEKSILDFMSLVEK